MDSCDAMRMLSRYPGCEFFGCIFGVILDALTLVRLILRSTTALAAENLFLRKQLGLLRRAKKEATSSYRLRSFHNGSTLKILRVALDLDGRQTGHAGPLASKRIPMFSEMEVSFERSAESSDRSTKVDRPHGFEQSHVG